MFCVHFACCVCVCVCDCVRVCVCVQVSNFSRCEAVRSGRRPITLVRLMHHNNEFAGRQYAAAARVKSAVHSSLPDPLENMTMVIGKEPGLVPLRDRRYVDLPGNNRGRGWQQLSLKSEEACKSIICGSSGTVRLRVCVCVSGLS